MMMMMTLVIMMITMMMMKMIVMTIGEREARAQRITERRAEQVSTLQELGQSDYDDDDDDNVSSNDDDGRDH